MEVHAGLNGNMSPKEGRELTSILLLRINLNKRDAWHEVKVY